MTNLNEKKQAKVNANFSDEHHEEFLPFALPDDQSFTEIEKDTIIETEGGEDTFIATELKQASHSNLHSIDHKFIQKIDASNTADYLDNKAGDDNNQGSHLVEQPGLSSLTIGMHRYCSSSYNKDERASNTHFEKFHSASSACGSMSSLYSLVGHQREDNVINGLSRLKRNTSLNSSVSLHQQDHNRTLLFENGTKNCIDLKKNTEGKISEMNSGSWTTVVSSTINDEYIAVSNNPFDQCRERIILRRNLSRSFEITAPMPTCSSVKEVIDIISNPHLLQIWFEPVNELIITDRNYGSPPCHFPPSSSDGPVDNIRMYRSPHFEQKAECGTETDGDIIVRSASEEEAMKLKNQSEQYDGEWIKASTTMLKFPSAHTNILERSLEKSKAAIGFPTCGSIIMFIEKNKAQVGITVGPFKGGAALSHTITVSQDAGQSVVVLDAVTVLDGEKGDPKCCLGFSGSCINVIQGTGPSVDGFIEQTMTSLENLRSLVHNQGRTTMNHSNGRYSYSMKNSAMTQPLLAN